MTDEYRQDAVSQAREMGEMQGTIKAMGREIGELKEAITGLTEAVQDLRTQLSEARGGGRMLMLLGGAGATFGGAFVWAADHLPKFFTK
jgi:prefoldin subunit 5